MIDSSSKSDASPTRSGALHPVDPSWWFVDAMRYEAALQAASPDARFETTSLSGVAHADVVIVGGGFAGMWTALTLKKRDPSRRVVLIEAKTCGSGASGKNGGMVSGYWSRLGKMSGMFGDTGALAVARAAQDAQDIVRDFVHRSGEDLGWFESETLSVSTHAEHDPRIDDWLTTAARFGVPDIVRRLESSELKARCGSPLFRAGAVFSGGAYVHPARLARALRRAIIRAGVVVYENTPMISLERTSPARVTTTAGEVIAPEVVLATNIALSEIPEVAPYLSLFSSYVAMTEPSESWLERASWTGPEGFADMRLFLRYARKTPDARILAGWGGGPLAYGARHQHPILNEDRSSGQRAIDILPALFPQAGSPQYTKTWGGGIDVSSDRMPFFKTLPGTRIHYAGGFTGHGVNATCLAGQCMASLVLRQTDAWSMLPLCTRDLPSLPPEPWRYLGARAIRWGILNVEDAAEAGRSAGFVSRGLAALPKAFGMRIGTR